MTTSASPTTRDPIAPAVAALTAHRGAGSWRGVHPYAKWRGSFWRLATLVDLGADRTTPGIEPMLEHAFGWLVSAERTARFRSAVVDGRVRWCAGQDGIGVLVASRLGRVDDPRTRLLVDHLVEAQWPDGGWNCDVTPSASHSSLHETHGPLRGLAAYHHATRDPAAGAAVRRAARLLLDHRLYRSRRTGQVIHPSFVELHWPAYWHYDVLVGLRGVDDAGLVHDPAATEALDLLEDARAPDGTWRPSGRRWWRPPGARGSNAEVIDLTELAPVVISRQARTVHEHAGRPAPARPPAQDASAGERNRAAAGRGVSRPRARRRGR